MNEWNEGYFTDTTYVYGYYRDICPAFQKFCLLVRGTPPPVSAEPAHCELAYGQGVSVNIHAAATPGRYVGTDFNPAQAAFANELLNASGSEAKFYEYSFEQMLEVDNLPQFDSISLHGIWSWISEENRRHIVEFARRYLKPGGIFYVSYNCLPGWAAHAPMRELFALYDRYAHSSTDTFKRVEEAIKFTEDLFAAEPHYVKQVTTVQKYFENVRKNDHTYLAHEYFNGNWDLMYFVDVLESLQSAKLEFVGSTDPMDSIERLTIPQKAIDFLAKVDNPVMREQTKDYFINRQFRKDLYVRGRRSLNTAQQFNALLDTRYVLLTTAEISLKFASPVGEITLQERVNQPLIEYLREDECRPKNLREFALRYPDVSPADIIQAIVILVGRNLVLPCQTETETVAVAKNCRNLNEYICRRAEYAAEINYLASPVTGGGFPMDRFRQMFLLYSSQGKQTTEELAQAVWQKLSAQGQYLVKSGKPIPSAEENLAELRKMATDFSEKEMPIYRALQLCI